MTATARIASAAPVFLFYDSGTKTPDLSIASRLANYGWDPLEGSYG
jgi:hypothetical protein